MPEAPIAGRPAPLPDGYETVLVSYGESLYSAAEDLEYSIFLASGYVEPNDQQRVLEYDPWLEVSKFIAVIDEDLQPVGVVRVLIDAYDALPVAKLERTDFTLIDPVCEYASLAVSPTKRSTGVAEELYRAVWFHAQEHGATALVAIVDPWLHDLLRDYYGFAFERLGPSVYFMGGDVHPIGWSVAEPYTSLPSTRPELWAWLLEGKPAKQLR